MSCVTYHLSHVTCYVSKKNYFSFLFFFGKSGLKGLLSMGPTPHLVYCTVPYCTVVYCSVLYYSSLLNCTALYCSVQSCTHDCPHFPITHFRIEWQGTSPSLWHSTHSVTLISISSFLSPLFYLLISISSSISPHFYLLSSISSSLSPHLYLLISISLFLSPHFYIDVHSSAANWSSGQIFITSIQISLIIFLFFILGFQKRIASICL